MGDNHPQSDLTSLTSTQQELWEETRALRGKSTRFVSVGAEPVEGPVQEKDELATARLSVGGDDPFPHPTSDDLLVGVEKTASCLVSITACTSGTSGA